MASEEFKRGVHASAAAVAKLRLSTNAQLDRRLGTLSDENRVLVRATLIMAEAAIKEEAANGPGAKL